MPIGFQFPFIHALGSSHIHLIPFFILDTALPQEPAMAPHCLMQKRADPGPGPQAIVTPTLSDTAISASQSAIRLQSPSARMPFLPLR